MKKRVQGVNNNRALQCVHAHQSLDNNFYPTLTCGATIKNNKKTASNLFDVVYRKTYNKRRRALIQHQSSVFRV